MNIIFLKVNIALFGYPSIFAVDYESIDMKQLIFIFTVAWGAVVGSRAQEVLTLDDCLRWGIENNLSLRGQRNEIQKSKYAISENRAKLLPQINGVANFNDNFDPPVSVTDGSAYDKPYNVTRRCSIMPQPDCSFKCHSIIRRFIPLFPFRRYWMKSAVCLMKKRART